MVLLIGCANTANLLLARAAARRPEMAMRLALGGSRMRLMQQVLIEGFVIGALGGLGGFLLATLLTRALVLYASAGRTVIALDLPPNLRVLAFTLAVSLRARWSSSPFRLCVPYGSTCSRRLAASIGRHGGVQA